MGTVAFTVINGTGSGLYGSFSYVGISAYAAPAGKYFSSWTSSGIDYIANRLAQVTTAHLGAGNGSATANYNWYYYTVYYNAGGGGYISGSSPQGVRYGLDTSSVTAIPYNGYYFDHWNDGALVDTRYDTNITYDRTYTAYFIAYPATLYTLTVNNGTGGGSYQQGTNVAIVANTPLITQHFTFWSGDITGITDIYSASTNIYTQAANATITANYASNAGGPWTLTYTAGSGGTIVGSTPQIVANHADGTEVIATANNGYRFTSWSDGVTTPARTDLDVQGDITVTASFALSPAFFNVTIY
jgi:hypothetical protein